MRVLGLIMSISPYRRSAMVWFPLASFERTYFIDIAKAIFSQGSHKRCLAGGVPPEFAGRCPSGPPHPTSSEEVTFG